MEWNNNIMFSNTNVSWDYINDILEAQTSEELMGIKCRFLNSFTPTDINVKTTTYVENGVTLDVPKVSIQIRKKAENYD